MLELVAIAVVRRGAVEVWTELDQLSQIVPAGGYKDAGDERLVSLLPGRKANEFDRLYTEVIRVCILFTELFRQFVFSFQA